MAKCELIRGRLSIYEPLLYDKLHDLAYIWLRIITLLFYHFARAACVGCGWKLCERYSKNWRDERTFNIDYINSIVMF